MENFMTIEKAFEIMMKLAKKEHIRRGSKSNSLLALNTVEDFLVNNIYN